MFWTRPDGDFSVECIVIQDDCATRDLTFGYTTIKAKEVHYNTRATLKYGGYTKVIDQKELNENIEKYLRLESD